MANNQTPAHTHTRARGHERNSRIVGARRQSSNSSNLMTDPGMNEESLGVALDSHPACAAIASYFVRHTSNLVISSGIDSVVSRNQPLSQSCYRTETVTFAIVPNCGTIKSLSQNNLRGWETSRLTVEVVVSSPRYSNISYARFALKT